MRVCFKVIACAFCFLIYLFVSSLIFLARRRLSSRLVRLFALCLVRILNIRVKTVSGPSFAKRRKPGLFLVSNHLGYIDGFVLGSLFSLIYVSKSELKDWPLIGLMTKLSGTLFIDRNNKSRVNAAIAKIAARLRAGENCLFFPEGTSTDGSALLPFKPAFFQAPLDAAAPIAPISLVYKAVNGGPVILSNRDLLCWYGEMTFFNHFLRLLSLRSIEVEVKIHPLIFAESTGIERRQRKEVSALAYETIKRDVKLIA